MRKLLLLILIVLPAPATAGLRATYAGAEPGKALVVEVGDDGSARIGEAGAPDHGIWRDGHFHIVGVAGNRVTVARIEDVAAAIDRVVPPIFGDLLDRASAGQPARRPLRVEQKGAREIGGVRGRALAVYGLDRARPDAATEFVMTDDPRLKPVGRALEAFMNAAVMPAAPLVGAPAAEMIDETRFLFSLGTPLVAGTGLTLVSVETATIPPARFELPARPETVDGLVAAMRGTRR